MKKTRDTIPVYDLCMISHNRLHHDISAGSLQDYYRIRDKLIIPHRHAYYHIFLFVRGTGTVTVDFEQFDLVPGRIYFMIPGQVHWWKITDEDEGYGLNFSENLFHSFIANPDYLLQFPFLRGLPEESVMDLKGDALSEATYFFKQIIQEAGKKDSFSLDQVCFHLMSLFISVSRHENIPVRMQTTVLNQKILHQFRTLVNQNYKEKKLPREYATMLYITPQRLNTISNEQLGISAGEIIRNRILLEAKRLLVNVDMSITEIAYELNFSDNSYFTKFFKKYTNATPEDFRKQYAS